MFEFLRAHGEDSPSVHELRHCLGTSGTCCYKDLEIMIDSQPMKVEIEGNVASGNQEIEHA